MKARSKATVKFIALGVLAVAALSCNVGWKDTSPFVTLASADAKNGDGKGGGRGGKGGGQGGKGEAGNKAGKGQNGSNGNAKGRAAAVARKEVTEDSVVIRYRNGYVEQVAKGRFIMKDSKGRTIVNRQATARDHIRLWLKANGP